MGEMSRLLSEILALGLPFSKYAVLGRRRNRTNINGRAWLNTQAIFLDRKTGAGFLSPLAQSFDRPTWGPERNVSAVSAMSFEVKKGDATTLRHAALL